MGEHWFAPNGTFLELQRIPIEPASMAPGQRVWQDGKVVAEALSWKERVQRQLAVLKEQLGFVPCDILVRKFESEGAAIFDLPGEYVQFQEDPEAYSKADRQAYEGYLRKWRQAKDFVLEFTVEYWMNEAGEVTSS